MEIEPIWKMNLNLIRLMYYCKGWKWSKTNWKWPKNVPKIKSFWHFLVKQIQMTFKAAKIDPKNIMVFGNQWSFCNFCDHFLRVYRTFRNGFLWLEHFASCVRLLTPQLWTLIGKRLRRRKANNPKQSSAMSIITSKRFLLNDLYTVVNKMSNGQTGLKL